VCELIDKQDGVARSNGACRKGHALRRPRLTVDRGVVITFDRSQSKHELKGATDARGQVQQHRSTELLSPETFSIPTADLHWPDPSNLWGGESVICIVAESWLSCANKVFSRSRVRLQTRAQHGACGCMLDSIWHVQRSCSRR
jgi:hypothetical protein